MGIPHPSVFAFLLSMAIWEWVAAAHCWQQLRTAAASIEAEHANILHEDAKGEEYRTIGGKLFHFQKLRTPILFPLVLRSAAKVFPAAVNPSFPPRLAMVKSDPDRLLSPFLGRFGGGTYYVIFPELLARKMPFHSQEFVLAHEVSHYCLRKTWHHRFLQFLFWASTVATLMAIALATTHSFFVLTAFLVLQVTAMLVGRAISRHAERMADYGALRICLESRWISEKYDWGHIVEDVFLAFLPQEDVWRLRDKGYNIRWRSSVSFHDDHPPPGARVAAVRAWADRFRQLVRDADESLKEYLRHDRRPCPCGSGKLFRACCAKEKPAINSQPWRG